MPDPIQVEQSFRELMEQFESTFSIRHRYHLFRSFIEILEGSFSKFESYILQIVDELPEFTEPLTWTGIAPSQIEHDLALLNKLETELQLSNKSENYTGIYKRLREVCILLYGCLNDLNGVNFHIERRLGIPGLGDPDDERDRSVLDLLKEWSADTVQNKRELSIDKKDCLKRIIQEANNIQETEDWKLLIPVAEKYQPEGIGYGRLRKVLVERYSETDKQDKLVWNMHVYGAENPSMPEKENVLIAARNLLESTSGKRNKNYYRGGVNFDFRNAFHVGNSANLAISALWYTHLQEATNQRNRYKLNSSSIITGDIDKEGNVLPVDNETIGLKGKAAFFSWGKNFVVPASQRGLFEKELNNLQERYPTRHVVLYGVSHLRELFFDRRLATHEEEGRIKYYFKRLKSQEFRFITVPLITLLLGFIIWLIFGPVDQNPVDAEYKGENLILKNQYGQTIRSFEVGNILVEDLQIIHESYGNRVINKTLFVDLNDDGTNEIVYAQNVNIESGSKEEKVIAYSLSGDSLIWEKQLRFELDFPNKQSISKDAYRVFDIDKLNQSYDNKKEIILNVAHEQLFPSLILKLNGNTGEELGRYVHTGRVTQIVTHDLNGDSKQEIIAFGKNNAFDQATVVFTFQADQIKGHSPLTEEYKIIGYRKGNELTYLRIPRSVVGEAFRKVEMNNKPYVLRVDQNGRDVIVRVFDFSLPDSNPFEVDQGSLFFYFNYDMEIQSIETSSNYDLWAKNLYEDGMIPFEPDHEYFEAFKDSLLYWDGEGFVFKNE